MGGKDVPSVNLGALLGKRLNFITTTLRTRSVEYKADLIDQFRAFGALEAFVSGEFKPIIDSTYPIE